MARFDDDPTGGRDDEQTTADRIANRRARGRAREEEQEEETNDADVEPPSDAPTPGPGDPTRDMDDGGDAVADDVDTSTPDTDGDTVVGGDRDPAPTPGPGDPTRGTEEEEAPTPGPGDPTRDMDDDQPQEPEQEELTSPGPGDPTRPDVGTVEDGTGAEVSGEGFLVGSGVASDADTASRIIEGQIVREDDRFRDEDIDVVVSEQGEVEVRLTETGAAKRSGVEPQVLSDDTTLTSVKEAAQDVEGQVVAETGVDRSEVAVSEFGLQPEFTEEGIEALAAQDTELAAGELEYEVGTIQQTETSQEARTAESLGVSVSDIDIEDGQVTATTEAGQEALKMPTRDNRGGGTGQAEAATQIQSQLEEQTGTELDREDITVEADGDVVRGALSEQGERTVAAENTPFQDTAISGLLETGARLDVRGSQFRQRNVERAQEATGIDKLFAGEQPFLDSVQERGEELINLEPADLFDSDVEEPDVTGGTLPVFSGTAGGTAGISRGAAAAGAGVGAGITAGLAALEGRTPTARTEVKLPDNLEQFPSNELTQPSRPGVFQSEVPIPDPTAMDTGPLGVPEQGISIDVTDNPSIGDTTEIDPQGTTTATELDIPETDSEEFVRADTATDTGGTTTGDAPSPSMPGDSLPTPGEVGGESGTTGGGFNIGRSRRLGQAKEVGRTFDESSVLVDAEERFLSMGEPTPSTLELLDFAEQAQASGDTGPGIDALGTPIDTGIADSDALSQATPDAFADATPQTLTFEDTIAGASVGATSTTAATKTPTIEAPKFQFPEPTQLGLGTPTFTQPSFSTPSRLPRLRVPDREPTSDDGEDDKRKSLSSIFDNPALAPDELGEFEEQLFEDLE